MQSKPEPGRQETLNAELQPSTGLKEMPSGTDTDANKLRLKAEDDSKDASSAHSYSVAEKSDLEVLDNRFEIVELVGEGGMGCVYKVLDRQLQKILALKVLRQALADDPQARRRFENEAAAAARLNHGNLACLYAHGSLSDGRPYLLMDFIEGMDLGKAIEQEKAMEAGRAIQLFQQLLDALEYIHEQGLLHRDIKPRNVILSRSQDGNETLKLVDFGIAKAVLELPGKDNGVTETGQFLGSPFYSSPEQCQGEGLDASSDLYSAACLLFEMLSGRPPYPSNNPVKVVVGHLSERPPLLSEACGNSRLRGLDAILSKCLAKQKKERYCSCDELRKALQFWMASPEPMQNGINEHRSSSQALWTLAAIGVSIVTFAVISPQACAPLWNVYEWLRPHCLALFGASVFACGALAVPMARARDRGEGIHDQPWLAKFWLLSYLCLVLSYSLLPCVPQGLITPYVMASGIGLVACLYFFIRYRAATRGKLISPFENAWGRALSKEERAPLALWRRFITALSIWLAICFKAPEFEGRTFAGQLVVASIVLIALLITTAIAARRLRSKQARPGDKWLMLGGLAGSIAGGGYIASVSVNMLVQMQVLPITMQEFSRTMLAPFALAPALTAIVFFAVWAIRKRNIAIFGKTDGW